MVMEDLVHKLVMDLVDNKDLVHKEDQIQDKVLD